MPLARYVPAEYPLYGLQDRGLDGTSRLSCSVRDMAAEYIEQIRAVQGSGPYHLLGWSFGGIAAQEIAVQLQADGEQVAALIIMDAYPPPGQQRDLTPVSHDGGLAEEANGPSGHAGLEASGEDSELADAMDNIRREWGYILEGVSDEELATLARIYQNNGRIMYAHELRRFEGDLLLIAAIRDKPADVSGVARWKPYVSGEVSESALPCEHAEMVRPDMLAQVWDIASAWLKLES